MAQANRKTTILYLADGVGIGGAEKQLYKLARGLDRSRYDIHLLTTDAQSQDLKPAFQEIGVKLHFMPYSNNRLLRMFNWFRTIRMLNAKYRIDVIHSWVYHYSIYAAVFGRMVGIGKRFGSMRHSFDPELLSKKRLFHAKFLFRTLDRVFSNSRLSIETMVELGLPAHKQVYLPNIFKQPELNAAEASQLDHYLRESGIDPADPVALSVANFRPVKNHMLLVKSLILIMKSNPNLHALLIGVTPKGHEYIVDELKTVIERSNLQNRFHFLGFRNDIPILLNRSSFLCLTSVNEGMSNVVMEAIMSATPVIIRANGGDIAKIFENESECLILDSTNPEDYAEAMTALLEDADYAGTMTNAAQAKAESMLSMFSESTTVSIAEQQYG